MTDKSETVDEMELHAAALDGNRDFRVTRRLRPLATPIQNRSPRSLRVAKVAIVDSETTGLNPLLDQLIDVGALTLEINADNGELVQVLGNWTGLQDPLRPIPENITALTGITNDMVAGASFDGNSLREMLAGSDVVIAHNAGFDRPFLEQAFPWLEEMAWGCSNQLIDWQGEGFGSSKLEFLAYRTGFFYDGHRALVDCHALARTLIDARLASAGCNAMARILQSWDTPDLVIYANSAPFEKKDVLKENAYRWNAEDRLWHKTVRGEAELQCELDWLRSSIYSNRSSRVQVEVRDAFVKYSVRKGLTEWRSIGPQGDNSRTFTSSGRRTAY